MGSPFNPLDTLGFQDQQQQQQQAQPMAQPAAQPQAAPNPIQAQIQRESQALQDQQPTSNRGGPIKRLLFNFLAGAGAAMQKNVGLPTQQEQQQQHLQNIVSLSNAQSQEEARQASEQYRQLLTQTLAAQQAKMGPAMAAQFQHPEWADLTLQQALSLAAKVQPAEIGAAAKIGTAQINQGTLQLPVDKDTAMLAGMPQLEGQNLGAAGWKTINAALNAKGIKIQDMGSDGPQGGLNMIDKAGNIIKHVSDTSPTFHRGIGFAFGRAMYTPFETVVPGTNQPTSISNLQALQQGAPRIGIGQAQTLGGTYAIYNDLLSKDQSNPGIFTQMRNVGSRINWSDPSVQARIAAGIEAIRDPASKGLMGGMLSTLVRSNINASLTPEEREFVILRGQAQAAGTGLRNVMGQRGVNEYQQQLDSGLMPRNIASTESLNQQLDLMEGLLGRVSIGLPQAGLNAPGTPTALGGTQGGGQGGADLGPAMQSNGQPYPEGHTGHTSSGAKTVVRGGRWVKQ